MESQEFEQPFKNEARVIEKYLSAFRQINNDRPCEVKGITGMGENSDVSRAWRIILTPTKTHRDFQIAGIFDWDDTLEPYTERKDKLYKSYLSLIPNAEEDTKNRFLKACWAINQAARVLPPTGVHPKLYAPILELVATSALIRSINEGQTSDLLTNQLSESNAEKAEEIARKYIQQNVLPYFSETIGVKTETRSGQLKDYFIEKRLQARAVDFTQKPEAVDNKVWELYKQYLTEANIPVNELNHFDLPENARFFVSSFGEADFQLEKIKNALKVLKGSSKRLPDEIILFTRGRKNPIIRKIIDSFPQAEFIYVDDSPRQIESLKKTPRLTLLHAQRKGSRRSVESVEGVRKVNMETTKMSEIISMVSSEP